AQSHFGKGYAACYLEGNDYFSATIDGDRTHHNLLEIGNGFKEIASRICWLSTVRQCCFSCFGNGAESSPVPRPSRTGAGDQDTPVGGCLRRNRSVLRAAGKIVVRDFRV